MQAGCKADTVEVFLAQTLQLDKMSIAFIVVVLDIAISFLFYFGLQHMKAMQLLTNQDINESIVMAQDFSVLLVGLP